MAEFKRKPEELITMFSEFLREMDRNTIRYMVDDMKEKIEKQAEIIAEKNGVIAEKEEVLQAQAAEIARLQALLAVK